MRALGGGATEPAREVRVQHAEPARPEPKLTRLDVDKDVVPHLDGPGDVGIRDARDAVDLAADEAGDDLQHGRDAPAAKRERHRGARA